MLSKKFIVATLVGIVLVIGFGMFPAFNTAIRNLNTVGLDTEMSGIARLFPYFLFFVIGYAAYIVFRRGKE
jgi:hypothetical protein